LLHLIRLGVAALVLQVDDLGNPVFPEDVMRRLDRIEKPSDCSSQIRSEKRMLLSERPLSTASSSFS
jgi:hypothetical protein